MEIGTTTKTIVSKGKGPGGKPSQQVVYKEAAYRMKGKIKFISTTKHELI